MYSLLLLIGCDIFHFTLATYYLFRCRCLASSIPRNSPGLNDRCVGSRGLCISRSSLDVTDNARGYLEEACCAYPLHQSQR